LFLAFLWFWHRLCLNTVYRRLPGNEGVGDSKLVTRNKSLLPLRYDEFGFRLEVDDGAEPAGDGSGDGGCGGGSAATPMPFTEDPQQRLMWVAFLEFTHNSEVGDLTWDKVGIDYALKFDLEKVGGISGSIQVLSRE